MEYRYCAVLAGSITSVADTVLSILRSARQSVCIVYTNTLATHQPQCTLHKLLQSLVALPVVLNVYIGLQDAITRQFT